MEQHGPDKQQVQTTFSWTINGLFAFDEQQIRSIANGLTEFAGQPTIEIECADDATRQFENIEQLYEYGNAKSRRIRALTLSSRTRWESCLQRSAMLRIVDSCFTGHSQVYGRISGLEAEVLVAKRDLDEITQVATYGTP